MNPYLAHYWDSNPRTAATRSLDSVPFYLGLFATFSVHWWLWSLPSLPPPRLPFIELHVFSQFPARASLSPPLASSSSVSVQSVVHLQQHLVTRRPSSGSPHTSGWLSTKVLLLVSCPASRMKVCPPLTCAAGGTWFRCGWRGVGDGAPCDGFEFLDTLTGVAQSSVPLVEALGPSSMLVVPVSLSTPPPPPPFTVQPYVSQYSPS